MSFDDILELGVILLIVLLGTVGVRLTLCKRNKHVER